MWQGIGVRVKDRALNRLSGYDYSQNGHYFVTICTHDRVEWFGVIENGEMHLNENGVIVLESWHDLLTHYHNLRLDACVVMPNHVHGIIIIDNGSWNGLKPFPTAGHHGLSEILRGFKTFSSRKINATLQDGKKFQWQKSFHDHIIRSEIDLNNIRQYIDHNPREWSSDRENISMT